MKQNLLIILLCFTGGFLKAQNNFVRGLIIDKVSDTAYREIGTLAKDFGDKYGELPPIVDLKPYCPPIQNQGKMGSCVGWATGYGAMTISYAKKYGWSKEEIKNKAFSSLFIYNQIKEGACLDGARIEKAVELLKTKGNIPFSLFDVTEQNCHKSPTIKEFNIAQYYKIKTYSTVFSDSADAKTKTYNTKKSLAKGVPVIIGMNTLRNFEYLDKSTSLWEPESGNTEDLGGHAMVVVGYHEGLDVFEIMNSWGSDWGNNGFFYIKYDDFATYCKYGYQLFLDENQADIPNPNNPQIQEEKAISMTGSFYFKYLMESHEIIFKDAAVEKTGDYTYELVRKDWDNDQMFQLVAKNLKKGTFVYVFSIDANRKTTVHWPRNKIWNEEYERPNLKETPYIPYNGETIIVPSKGYGLVKEVTGIDHVFILYSDNEIPNFETIVQNISISSDYEGALEGELGDKLMSLDAINYQDNLMKFRAKSLDGGIVPIILKQESH